MSIQRILRKEKNIVFVSLNIRHKLFSILHLFNFHYLHLLLIIIENIELSKMTSQKI